MRAIVCDKCGKTMLLEDLVSKARSSAGVYTLINDKNETNLDLCEECASELMEAVRKMKDGE